MKQSIICILIAFLFLILNLKVVKAETCNPNVCKYGAYTVTVKDDCDIKVEREGYDLQTDNSLKDAFKEKCAPSIYIKFSPQAKTKGKVYATEEEGSRKINLNSSPSDEGTIVYPKADEIDYENICENINVRRAMKIIGYVVLALRWTVPLIITVLGVLDFAKAVTTSDDKGLNKAINAFSRRIIAGIIVFIIPTIILAIINGVSEMKDNVSQFAACSKCIFNVSKCDGDGSSNTNNGGTDNNKGSNNKDSNYVK